MTGKVGILALLGAAVAGPAAAVVWPSTVKWGLVIVYEVVLFVASLASGVISELKKRWQTRAADRIDVALGRRFTRFDTYYREYILSALRSIDLKGLTTIGFYTPDLDDVFVDVSLDYRAPHQVSSGLLAGMLPITEGRHSIWNFLNRKEPVVLAVLGAPGSGKLPCCDTLPGTYSRGSIAPYRSFSTYVIIFPKSLLTAEYLYPP